MTVNSKFTSKIIDAPFDTFSAILSRMLPGGTMFADPSSNATSALLRNVSEFLAIGTPAYLLVKWRKSDDLAPKARLLWWLEAIES